MRGTEPAASRSITLRRLAGIACGVAVVVLLALAPSVLSDVYVSFLTGAAIWIGMVWAWDLLATAGYISLAVAGWYGLGAYSTVILMSTFGFPFLPAVAISAVIVGVLSVLIAVPLFRLRGHYFIMGTLIIAEVIYLVMNEFRLFGVQGASLMHFPTVTGDPSFYNYYFYWLAAGLLAFTFLVVVAVRRSRIGLALRAMGQDETTAETMGVMTARYKLIAFGISSALLALAGGLSAYWAGFVQQGTVFTPLITVKVIVIAILGGSGTLAGPVIGVLFIQYLEQIVGPTLADLNQIIYGLIVMAVAVLLPRGVVPSLVRMVKARLSASRRGSMG
jgi:branched-chain amino acid transport system permease protein